MQYHRIIEVSPDGLDQINTLLKAQHGGARTLTHEDISRILQTSELWVAKNSSGTIVAIGLAITVEALSHTMVRIHNLYTNSTQPSLLQDLLSDMVACIQNKMSYADIHIAIPVGDPTLTTDAVVALGFTDTHRGEFRLNRRI